jgi:drug/metabolite transporter (DMT)-like permease
MERNNRYIAGALLALITVLWTVAEILPTLLTPGYSLFQVIWVRYGTHLLCMLIVLVPRLGGRLFATKCLGLQLGRGLLMIVMPASYIFSIGRVAALDVLAVFWMAPLLLLALAALIQGERASWLGWIAALAATLGAQLILRPDMETFAALPFGLGMALSFSLYVVLTRSLRHERRATNLFYSALVVFVPLTFLMPSIWQPLTLRDTLLMIGVGVTGLGVLWAIDWACELVPVAVFAPIFAVQLALIAVLLPWLTGTGTGRAALLGAALIVGSACLGWLLPPPRKQTTEVPTPLAIEVKRS